MSEVGAFLSLNLLKVENPLKYFDALFLLKLKLKLSDTDIGTQIHRYFLSYNLMFFFYDYLLTIPAPSTEEERSPFGRISEGCSDGNMEFRSTNPSLTNPSESFGFSSSGKSLKAPLGVVEVLPAALPGQSTGQGM